MKKGLKIIFIVLGVLIGIIVVDTLQAKIFNNSPIIHAREYYHNAGGTNYIDRGIFVNYYKYSNGKGQTLFVWDNVTY